MRVEFLWFDDCPNHEAARRLLLDVLASHGIAPEIEDINVPDLATGEQVRFPGSPTVRIDGEDVEPGFRDEGDYTPRCRLYATAGGLRGLPEREWIEAAMQR